MSDDRLQRNPLGPVGRQVRDNVKLLRTRRGLTHQQLSDLIQNAGRPIPVLGISRIENGARRVDVDDLAMLAAVLGTSPLRLMKAPDPDSPLSATDYLEHEEAIKGAIERIVEVVVDGVPLEQVLTYIANVVAVESLKRKGGVSDG